MPRTSAQMAALLFRSFKNCCSVNESAEDVRYLHWVFHAKLRRKAGRPEAKRGRFPHVRGVITVIGFAASLKGAALIVVPQAALKANDMSARVLRIIGTAFVVVGAYLGFATYFGSA